jgi:hypothetical protein
MVPPSVITIAANDECLMCSGFSLGETVHFGSFKFIADHFNGLRLSPRRGDSGAAFMGLTHSGTPSLCQAMIEDSAKEFHMASGGEGASPTPVTTTPWMENVPATQATMTVPPWMVAPRPDTGLPFEQCHTRKGGSKRKPMLDSPLPATKLLMWSSCTHHHAVA